MGGCRGLGVGYRGVALGTWVPNATSHFDGG
jgi:hypothetical protein